MMRQRMTSNTYPFFILFFGFCSIAFAQKPIPRDSKTPVEWHPVFQGVEIARGIFGTGNSMQKCVATRIDLKHPGIKFLATASNGAAAKETFSERASDFLKKHQAQLVVNTSFFDPCCSSISNESKDVSGLAVAQGQLVSPWSDSRPVGIAVAKNNQPYVINRPPKKVDSLQFAFAGNTLIKAGKPTREPDDKKQPRTAAGFSKDGQYLIFVLIDGRRPFHSMGANLHDTAVWLARFGAWDGCNLDGGGSSTLVMDNGRGGYRLLNYPSSGRERPVGNLLGIFATSLGGIKAKVIEKNKP